jgi:hypothetical protein
MNVVYAPRAMRDLQSIGAYLVERNPAGAANVLGSSTMRDTAACQFFDTRILSTIASPKMSFSYFTSGIRPVGQLMP